MKELITVALLSLSIGWGMHASLAARFCIRCTMRSTALKVIKFGLRPMPNFARQIVFTGGMGFLLLIFLQDAARVFGWKQLFQITKSMITQLHGGKKNG